MRLPAPIFHGEQIYKFCEMQKPKAYVIADTKRVVDETGDLYTGMKTYLSGCIIELKSDDAVVSDPIALKTLIQHLPLKTAEYLCLKAAALLSPDDDGIEGYYPCPRCGFKVIAEQYEKDGIDYDTRDFVSELPIGYMENLDDNVSTFELTTPVNIVNLNNGQVIESIESITLKMPTLGDTIKAFQKFGGKDSVRLQFAQYVESIIRVNGMDVDNRWKSSKGMYVFENLEDMEKDTRKIGEWINQYGIMPKVEKRCPTCGKVWRPYVNTSNFFASGLQ